MADRGHADGDQVLARQVGQDVSVDEIVAECQLVLLKTKLLKLTRDINRHLKYQSRREPSIRRLCRASNGRGVASWPAGITCAQFGCRLSLTNRIS